MDLIMQYLNQDESVLNGFQCSYSESHIDSHSDYSDSHTDYYTEWTSDN